MPEVRVVKLHKETWERIKKDKHKGQTIDGFVNELLDHYSRWDGRK